MQQSDQPDTPGAPPASTSLARPINGAELLPQHLPAALQERATGEEGRGNGAASLHHQRDLIGTMIDIGT